MPSLPEKTGTPREQLCDPDSELRRLVTEMIRRCPKKRLQIAEELSAKLGHRVTEHMLNDFTSEGKKPARFPAYFIAPLCEIVGNDELQRFVMSERLRKLVDFAEREVAAQREQRDRDALRDELLGTRLRKGRTAP